MDIVVFMILLARFRILYVNIEQPSQNILQYFHIFANTSMNLILNASYLAYLDFIDKNVLKVINTVHLIICS